MPLNLRPARAADVLAIDRIVLAAFSIDGLMPLFYPSGYNHDDRIHGFRQSLKRLVDPLYKILIAVETDDEPAPEDHQALPEEIREQAAEVDQKMKDTAATTSQDPSGGSEGRIVGISLWKFHTQPRTAQELADEDTASANEPLPPSADQKFMTAFFTALSKSKREQLGGRPHVLLHILATDPAYHRKGVGAKSLAWGAQEADKLGLESYLEASRMGRPLYARWGYKEVGMLDFDARAAGADRDVPHWLMLRPVGGK